MDVRIVREYVLMHEHMNIIDHSTSSGQPTCVSCDVVGEDDAAHARLPWAAAAHQQDLLLDTHLTSLYYAVINVLNKTRTAGMYLCVSFNVDIDPRGHLFRTTCSNPQKHAAKTNSHLAGWKMKHWQSHLQKLASPYPERSSEVARPAILWVQGRLL